MRGVTILLAAILVVATIENVFCQTPSNIIILPTFLATELDLPGSWVALASGVEPTPNVWHSPWCQNAPSDPLPRNPNTPVFVAEQVRVSLPGLSDGQQLVLQSSVSRAFNSEAWCEFAFEPQPQLEQIRFPYQITWGSRMNLLPSLSNEQPLLPTPSPVYEYNGDAWCENAILPLPPMSPPISSPPVAPVPSVVIEQPTAPKVTVTVAIVLSGSQPPSQSIVSGICSSIANAFNPPLIVGVDINCGLQSKRRAVAAAYTILAQIQANPTTLAQASGDTFAASVQSSVAAVATGFTVSVEVSSESVPPQSISPAAEAPILEVSPNGNETQVASPKQQLVSKASPVVVASYALCGILALMYALFF